MTILMCLILFLGSSCPIVHAGEAKTYYARIMQADCYLYLSPVDADDYTNVLFTLPETYFVELLDNAGEDFFKVKYLNFYGYVKKEKVQTVVGTPQTPFLTGINFRVYAELSRDMRSCPNTQMGSTSQVVYIPNLSRNLTYYGKIVGECLIDGRTNVWYYCKYTADKDYYGYVYSDFCDEMTKITTNSEEMSYTTAPDFSPAEPEKTALPLENKTTGIVIAILSVPACLFVYLIVKSSKIVSTKRQQSKEVTYY